MSAHKNNPTEYSQQEIANESFNDSYKIIQGALYIYQASSDSFVPAQADSSGNLKTAGSSGSITNDGTFAKETGGNLASIVANQTNGTQKVGSANGAVNVAQVTSNTSAVQLSASATTPTNGITVQAIAANTANVYIGGSGVTTSNGFELQPGQSVAFTCVLNTLYVIGSNNTDKVCYNVA